ncbi:3-hydroxyisobutyryl-CoA hydrolase [Sarracenia purpurea var. burkii]
MISMGGAYGGIILEQGEIGEGGVTRRRRSAGVGTPGIVPETAPLHDGAGCVRRCADGRKGCRCSAWCDEGEYLGLTGATIDGIDMLACGLGTHFVLSKDLEPLENALSEVVSSDPLVISELINKFIYKGHAQQPTFYERQEIINKCFSGKTIQEILSSLEEEMESRADKWVFEAICSIKLASPTSLKVALRSVFVPL